MEVKLGKGERKIIREIALLQLNTLKKIINKDCEEDVELFCIQNEINEEMLMNMAKLSLKQFETVYDNPGVFLRELDTDNLSITKHLLFNNYENPKWDNARKKLWRKLYWNDLFTFNLN